MENGRWSSAISRLKSLVEEHGDQNYVHACRPEIQDCMASCVFKQSYEPPGYDKLVTGELLSYKESTGAVKLRYLPGKMEDFSNL